jgi:hypothetical protein
MRLRIPTLMAPSRSSESILCPETLKEIGLSLIRGNVEADLSAAQNRIAYYEQCPEAEHCTPRVVILDLEGRPIMSSRSTRSFLR